jgi:hypothetical protein
MADDLTTIIAALIGAVIGSLGAKLTEEILKRRNERIIIQQNLINQYLLQLQDNIESLWYRLDTLKKRGPNNLMKEKYFESSTIYTLACVLAFKRILLLEGVYSRIYQISPELGTFLNKNLEIIDSIIENLQNTSSFYRYQRIILAETVIQRIEGRLSTCTYVEFKKQYEDTNTGTKESLKPADDFLRLLKRPEIAILMDRLKTIAIRLGQETGIASSLVKEK